MCFFPPSMPQQFLFDIWSRSNTRIHVRSMFLKGTRSSDMYFATYISQCYPCNKPLTWAEFLDLFDVKTVFWSKSAGLNFDIAYRYLLFERKQYGATSWQFRCLKHNASVQMFIECKYQQVLGAAPCLSRSRGHVVQYNYSDHNRWNSTNSNLPTISALFLWHSGVPSQGINTFKSAWKAREEHYGNTPTWTHFVHSNMYLYIYICIYI